MRRVVLKSPVLENCTPGSVRGAPGNRRPYLANCIELTPLEPRFCIGLEKRKDVREESGKLPRHARAVNCCVR